MRLAPIFAAVLLAAGARAQTTGGISGVVVDEDGAPVARAVLIVSGPALQGERTANSDPSGAFDLEQAALAAPGLTRLPPGIHGPGTLADETRFVVDGIDVTDDRRVLATHLLQNFVEEVAVRTIPFAAEYGRASGALISAVTRSGGNEFHGSAFTGAIGDPRAIEGGFDLGGP